MPTREKSSRCIRTVIKSCFSAEKQVCNHVCLFLQTISGASREYERLYNILIYMWLNIWLTMHIQGNIHRGIRSSNKKNLLSMAAGSSPLTPESFLNNLRTRSSWQGVFNQECSILLTNIGFSRRIPTIQDGLSGIQFVITCARRQHRSLEHHLGYIKFVSSESFTWESVPSWKKISF